MTNTVECLTIDDDNKQTINQSLKIYTHHNNFFLSTSVYVATNVFSFVSIVYIYPLSIDPIGEVSCIYDSLQLWPQGKIRAKCVNRFPLH